MLRKELQNVISRNNLVAVNTDDVGDIHHLCNTALFMGNVLASLDIENGLQSRG